MHRAQEGLHSTRSVGLHYRVYRDPAVGPEKCQYDLRIFYAIIIAN